MSGVSLLCPILQERQAIHRLQVLASGVWNLEQECGQTMHAVHNEGCAVGAC